MFLTRGYANGILNHFRVFSVFRGLEFWVDKICGNVRLTLALSPGRGNSQRTFPFYRMNCPANPVAVFFRNAET